MQSNENGIPLSKTSKPSLYVEGTAIKLARIAQFNTREQAVATSFAHGLLPGG